MDELKQIDVEKFQNNHSFLAEELLVPNVNKCDTTRINMFCSHVAQALVLKHTEFPKIFTGFENMIGKYSRAYKIADRNWKVLTRIVKNDLNMLYVVVDENGYHDVINRRPADRITEAFGYVLNNDVLDSKIINDTIEKGEIIYRSSAYDENMNFGFGTNLKALYIPWKGLTYEDAIVISESAAEKLTSYSVRELSVNINTNDILCNIYGDVNNYKCFPDIGEEIKDQILLARRRINYESALYSLSTENLSKIDFINDAVMYSRGKIVDIDIYSNADIKKLENKEYNNQIVKYLKSNLEYYRRIVEVLEPIIEKGREFYSDDLAYIYKRAKDICDPQVRWRNDRSDFDHIVIKFKILNEQKLVVGSKLTGRYGNKGVVSVILPDEEMPINEYGERAEIILNPLGVFNRTNIAQLYEHELNFISSYIVRKIKEMFNNEQYDEIYDFFFDYIRTINPEQADQLEEYYDSLDDESASEFWDDILEKGIYLLQPPFYGNISFDTLMSLYAKYPDLKPIKFEGIERPQIFGELYFLRLKHDPKTKFSARSSAYANMKDMPSKSTSFKDGFELYPKTPVRLGEMETFNLAVANNSIEELRFRAQYSYNEMERRNFIEALMTENIFDLDRVEMLGTENKPGQILDILLRCIGIELVKETEEE